MKLTGNELREFNEKELKQKLVELKEELFKLNFRKVTNTLDDNTLIPKARRNIAKVLTVLRERQIKEERP